MTWLTAIENLWSNDHGYVPLVVNASREYGGKNTMGRGFNIPWVGGQNTMGRGSIYHG